MQNNKSIYKKDSSKRQPMKGRFIVGLKTYNESISFNNSYKELLFKKHLQIGVQKGAITQEAANESFQKWKASKQNLKSSRVENVGEKSILTVSELKSQILNENTKIAIHQAFQNEFEKSLNQGFPLSMLINDTIIQLNPDNTYEVTPNEKRELNTVKEIYLK